MMEASSQASPRLRSAARSRRSASPRARRRVPSPSARAAAKPAPAAVQPAASSLPPVADARRAASSSVSEAEACGTAPATDAEPAAGTAPPPPAKPAATAALLHLNDLHHEKHRWFLPAVSSPFVHSRYRRPLADDDHWRAALRSLLLWEGVHNETCNIFTHLTALLATVAVLVAILASGMAPVFELGVQFLPSRAAAAAALVPPEAFAAASFPTWPISLFLGGFMSCTLGSTLYHTFVVVSPRAFQFLLRIDYAAICALVVSCGISACQHVFHCLTGVAAAMSIACLVCGGALIVLIATGRMETLGGAARVGLFAGLTAANLFPLIGILVTPLRNETPMVEAVLWAAACVGIHGVGGALYALRFPERWWPGWFDLFYSHTLMHVCVNVGSFCYFLALCHMHSWRLMPGNSDCAAPGMADKEWPWFLWQ